jgi:gas vesicle protein
MRDDRDTPDPKAEGEEAEAEQPWDRNSFLTGLVLGAAVGAGLALLFAPASGEDTRRLVRRRTRALARDAEAGWTSARKEARQALRDKKEALRERLEQGLEKIEDRLEG